jgi:hypothetical protein
MNQQERNVTDNAAGMHRRKESKPPSCPTNAFESGEEKGKKEKE